MADNVPITPGAGADVATDDIAGVHFQRVKLTLGADGVNDGDVSSGNALPVEISGELPAGTQNIGDVDVLSVVPGTGATNLGKAEDAVHSSGDVGVMALAVRNDTPSSLAAAGDYHPLSVDSTGRLQVRLTQTNIGEVSLAAGTTNIGDVDVLTLPVAFNSGATSSTTQRVIEATDSPGNIADDAAFTVGTTAVKMAGFLADETSTDSVNEGDGGAARMTLDRKQIVSVYPSATGEGLSIYRNIDLDEADVAVKASAGKLFGWYMHNASDSIRYVKFYNATTASVTVGTTTPVLTIPLPAGAAANVEYTNGIAFSTAITAACTTGVADNDTGAPAANDVQVNIFYA